jgi:phosphohistidine phosphatase
MRLYLVRHGEALSEEEDPKRPLSEKGRGEVQRVASLLEDAGVLVGLVQHSGKLRAVETAAILSGPLSRDGTITHRSGLKPNDPVEPLAQQLCSMSDTDSRGGLMLVGHLPFMERLASQLLCDDPESGMVRFPEGGVLCLEGAGKEWTTEWFVIPDVVRR